MITLEKNTRLTLNKSDSLIILEELQLNKSPNEEFKLFLKSCMDVADNVIKKQKYDKNS